MAKTLSPTRYEDVNGVLQYFQEQIQGILGTQFRGMYVYGSLALGDFDPQSSDIDFIVVTDSEIDDVLFAKLSDMHTHYAESDSAWSENIEAAYIPQYALEYRAPTASKYPQLEKGTPLFKERLEPGWAMQRYVLREHGIVITGPHPKSLMSPVNLDDMHQAIAEITGTWLDQASHDPSWLDWLRQQEAQSFVVLTLCRSLYTLETGKVASKPAAARWAQETPGLHWSELIEHALQGQHAQGKATQTAIDQTLALLQYVVDAAQQ